MSRTISSDILRQITFIDNLPSEGKAVFLVPHYDNTDNTFKLYLEGENRELTFVYAEPVDACYWSTKLINPKKDMKIKIFETLAQYHAYPSVISKLAYLIEDLNNCCSIFEKYFMFVNVSQSEPDNFNSSIFLSDYESHYGNIRSIYDILQWIISDLWKIYFPKRNQLKTKFSDMVKQEAKDLELTYNMEQDLLNFYAKTSPFFKIIKDIRDNVFHSGRTVTIYRSPQGFSISKNGRIAREYDAFSIWPPEKERQNGIVSLLALLAFNNTQLMNHLDFLDETILNVFPKSAPLSCTAGLFYRNPRLYHLLNLEYYLKHQWIIDPQETFSDKN